MSQDEDFSELSKAFKLNPTIENYVKLRRDNPNNVIEIAVSSGLEWLFSNEELLTAAGIPPLLVGGILEADQKSISQLSLLLLEKIIERKALEKEGKTHLVGRGHAIGDSLIDYLICMILDSLEWNNDLRLDRDFIVLLRERLGGVDSKWEREQDLSDKKMDVLWIALQLIAEGKTPSIRSVAKIMRVNPTTVMRWLSGSDLINRAKQLAKNIEKHTCSDKLKQ